MKTKALFIGFLLTVILFIDYLVVSLIGCIARICNASDNFYCSFFCKFIILLVIL